jgi:hypothetical protein
MSFDLATEVDAVLNKLQDILGHAVAESKGQLPSALLRLNGLYQELQKVRDDLGAEKSDPGHASPQSPESKPASTHDTAETEWGAAFKDVKHSQKSSTPAPVPTPPPVTRPRPSRRSSVRMLEIPEEGEDEGRDTDSDTDLKLWDDLD